MAKLEDDIKLAIEKNKVPGIIGYDLNNPNKDYFEEVELSENRSKFIPINEDHKVVFLGSCGCGPPNERDDPTAFFYVLLDKDDNVIRYIKELDYKFEESRATTSKSSDIVPNYILAEFPDKT